jgi:hypothetical protein
MNVTLPEAFSLMKACERWSGACSGLPGVGPGNRCPGVTSLPIRVQGGRFAACATSLRADASTDADGDTLADAWSIDSAPAGSRAVLSSTNAVAPTFTADVEGSYVFRLRVTDTKGALSERTVVLDVVGHAPVAVIDRGIVTVIVGSVAHASAALSSDADGDALSYQWSVDARPTGSVVALPVSNTANVNFVPDVVASTFSPRG